MLAILFWFIFIFILLRFVNYVVNSWIGTIIPSSLRELLLPYSVHLNYCSCYLREMLVFLFHLINLLLVFSWLFNSWSLSAFESEIKSWMMCSCSLETRVNIWGLQLYINIFVIIVGRSKCQWIDPKAFLFFWLLCICRFLVLKNTKAEQVKLLHICCWSNLYLD